MLIACARLPVAAGCSARGCSAGYGPPAAARWQQQQQQQQRHRQRLPPAASAPGGAPSLVQEAAASESDGEELMPPYSVDLGDDEEQEQPSISLELASKPLRQRRAGDGEWDAPPTRLHGGPVTMAGQRYESLLELREQMRALQRQLLPEGQEEVEVPPDSPHFGTILALFQRHPTYRQKAREPVASFFVVRNPYVSDGQGYEFQYTDARGPTFRDDFSLLKCTRPRPRVRRRNLLMEACTVAVEDQVEETAAAAQGPNGTRVCARCGGGFKVEVLYTGWPLSKLVQEFAVSDVAPGRPPSKFAKPAGSSQLAAFRQRSEADAAWEQGWQEYHRQHARLRPLCKHCASWHIDAARERAATARAPYPRRQSVFRRPARQQHSQQQEQDEGC